MKLGLSSIAAALLLSSCQMATDTPAPDMQIAGAEPLNPAQAEAVRKLSGEVLFWDDETRLEKFQAMESIFPAIVEAGSASPQPLPKGQPLAISEADVDSFLSEQGAVGLLVLQDGDVRLERYASGLSSDSHWTSFSMAKSVTSMLAGYALADGSIGSLDDPVTDYVPELKASGYDGVTVEQVLTMRSGVAWNEDYTDPKSDVVRMFADPVPVGEDPDAFYLAKLGRESEPGSKFKYKTGETNLLGLIVQRATHKRLADYAAETIIPAAGLESSLIWQTNGAGLNAGGCCLSMTLRDYGRLGEWVRKGAPGLDAPGYVKAATTAHTKFKAPGFGYGYQWWTFPQGYGALGIFGQAIMIVPEKKLVVVMLSNWPTATADDLRADQRAMVAKIAGAL